MPKTPKSRDDYKCTTLADVKKSLTKCELYYVKTKLNKSRKLHPSAIRHWNYVCAAIDIVFDKEALTRALLLNESMATDYDLDSYLDLGYRKADINALTSRQLYELEEALLSSGINTEQTRHILYRMCFDQYRDAWRNTENREAVYVFAREYVDLALQDKLACDDGEDVEIKFGHLSPADRQRIVQIVMDDTPDEYSTKKKEVIARLYGWTDAAAYELGPLHDLSHKSILAIADIVAK